MVFEEFCAMDFRLYLFRAMVFPQARKNQKKQNNSLLPQAKIKSCVGGLNRYGFFKPGEDFLELIIVLDIYYPALRIVIMTF